MKIYIKIIAMVMIGIVILFQSCKEDFLDEKPLSLLNTEGVLESEEGFENYIVALHQAARGELSTNPWAQNKFHTQQGGTDDASYGHVTSTLNDYNNLQEPTDAHVFRLWDWAYREMLLRANTVITYAEKPELEGIWSSEESKNAFIAEAKFFRAYTYNSLANVYGGVPVVNEIFTAVKTDFVRNTREEVLNAAREDLEFASQWLPETVPEEKEGRIVKAAADHLLTEVYISLGRYDDAIASGTRVIDSGLYHLMTERFGTRINQPGDVFSDLFKIGNQNRSSGNMESIYVWQFEEVTPGGQGNTNGNPMLRNWMPWYTRILDPEGKSGMVRIDSIGGYGYGQLRPTPYMLYDVWQSDWDTDMRNSSHNWNRVWYYNNPASDYYGQPIEPKTAEIDTMQYLYPYPRKIEAPLGIQTYSTPGLTNNDFMVYRLAETYLLRAEAYFRKGDLENSANDINTVRARAHASLIEASDVTEDYILDERARELFAEEGRRKTLVRMGRFVDRVRKYSIRDVSKNSIQDFHKWWPIPQAAIDANIGATLEQNPGY